MKLFKRFVVSLTMVSLLLSVTTPVFAMDEEIMNEAAYDLKKGGTQSFTIQDDSGYNVIVTVAELPVFARSLENRSYKVSYRSLLAWEAGYNVVINNNRISSVNSPYHVTFAGAILGGKLQKDSSKQATYSFVYKIGGINTSTGVRTNIVDEQLKVTVL